MSVSASLLLKLAMLGTTAALVLWIGWPVPDDEPAPAPAPQASQEAPSSPEPVAKAQGASKLAAAAPAPTRPTRLDLNRASVAELTALPGLGEVLAQRVVERRAARGGFRSVDDLKDVKGIGAKRLEQLRPLVTVRAATPNGKQRGDNPAGPTKSDPGHL
jgi:competence protein ComEA